MPVNKIINKQALRKLLNNNANCIKCKFGERSSWVWCEYPDSDTGVIETIRKESKNYHGECKDFVKKKWWHISFL